MRPRTWRRIRRWSFLGAAGTIAVLIIASFALSSFPGGIGSDGRTSAVEDVGTSVAILGADHIPTGESANYNSTPPTSGNHWGSPADCGIYGEELRDERVVHNMEHGHVIISYNLDTGDTASLLELAKDLPSLENWGIVRPYAGIEEGTVAMTAWGVIDLVQGVDEESIRTFYGTYIRNRFSDEAARVGPIPCTSSTHSG